MHCGSELYQLLNKPTAYNRLYRMRGLDDLPVELLYEIFILARNECLPHTSKYLYSVFKYAPSSVQAEYIVFYSLPTPDLLSKILRFPICTVPVLESLLRIPSCAELLSKHARSTTKVPRRLFRSLAPKRPNRVVGMRRKKQREPWSSDDAPIPFLQYLLDEPHIPDPDLDSSDGYPLVKAVGAGFIPLVRFLLENGASPAYKQGLAVRIAITRKDLPLVRMLIEPDGSVKDADGRKVQRRRMEDRVSVNQEMLKVAVKAKARDIVDYLMKEKGCIPDMQTVMMI